MAKRFHRLRIADLTRQTDDAMSVTFEVPASLREAFVYQPGQHLTIKFMIDGTEARRSYSLNSCPQLQEPLQVTVKRIKGGLVSNYVNDRLRVGDELDVMPPTGQFAADIQPDNYRHHFLFAAGSGITPVLSILKAVLHAEKYSFVHLFYGNKNKSSILFRTELDALQEQFPDRFTLVHTLSEPYSDGSWWWNGRTGRIDQKAVAWFIDEHPPRAQTTEYFICGPGTMNTTVRETLLSLGVPQERVHIELFGGRVEAAQEDVQPVDRAHVCVTLDGKMIDATVPQGQTILDVLKANQHDPPYSCEAGVCSTCRAKLQRGTVHMRATFGLDEQDIGQGYILTCQALPTSPDLEISYDA